MTLVAIGMHRLAMLGLRLSTWLDDASWVLNDKAWQMRRRRDHYSWGGSAWTGR